MSIDPSLNAGPTGVWDQQTLPFPRVSGDLDTIPVRWLSRDPPQVGKGLFPTTHVKRFDLRSGPG